MSETYKLQLKQKTGLLTKLHSDTIFGHFCWRLRETLGENKLAELLEMYGQNNPVFTLSGGILERDNELFFPKPLLQTPYQMQAVNKHERIKSFLELKEQKDKKFITGKQLDLYINNRTDEYKKSFSDEYHSKLKYPSLTDYVRMHVQIDRQSLTALDENLYSTAPQYTDKDTTVAILIKVIDKQYFDNNKLGDILKFIFELGFGSKKSSGYGEFEVGEIESFNRLNEPEDSNGFIALGNYLPSESDEITDQYYDTNVKYGRMGEEYASGLNPFKKPILFLTAGSCFFTGVKREFYGRCTNTSEISDSKANVIQCGMPFTLRARFSNKD